MNDGCRLPGNLIEHAAVVFRVGSGGIVVHGDRADHAIADHQRTDQRGLELDVGCRHSRADELRNRQPVDQRPAMSRHPPTQSVTFCDRRILEQVGVQAGGESAAQILVCAPHEQRTRRERYERGELRTDEGHHVREAHASSHRLCDFIQRVRLAVGRRDLREYVGARSRPPVKWMLMARLIAGATHLRPERTVRRWGQDRQQLGESRDDSGIECLAGLVV